MNYIMINKPRLVDYSLFESKINKNKLEHTTQNIFTYNLFINMFVILFLSILLYLLYLRYINIEYIKDKNISDILFLHNYINGRTTNK